METIDPSVYRAILATLKARYPAKLQRHEFGDLADKPGWLANMAYLHEHGLVNANIRLLDMGQPLFATASITAAGIDFLREDGGLTRERGAITIRMDDNQLRLLLIDRVAGSDLPPEEKSRVKTLLQDLGTDGLKTLLQKGLEHAMAQGPVLLELLRTHFGP